MDPYKVFPPALSSHFFSIFFFFFVGLEFELRAFGTLLREPHLHFALVILEMGSHEQFVLVYLKL
jgi:Kef-type K+ transport system membrane component KefB